MSEMIERVANAIAAKYAPAIDQRAPYAKIMMLEAAKAAIEAMRDPTEAMCRAPQKAGATVITMEGNQPLYPGNARQAWRLMIDDALGPPEQPGGA